jgi:hypothetical protein
MMEDLNYESYETGRHDVWTVWHGLVSELLSHFDKAAERERLQAVAWQGDLVQQRWHDSANVAYRNAANATHRLLNGMEI